MRANELIALLLPETKQDTDEDVLTGLFRDAEGRMSLKHLTREWAQEMPFKEQVMTTGCFRRGKPIVDPVSREVIGYEMEMIAGPEARLTNARQRLGFADA